MHPVGADDDVRLHPGTVGERQHRPAAADRNGGAALAEVDGSRGNGVADHVQEVGPMDGVGVLSVEPLTAAGEILGGNDPPVLPAAEFPAHVQPDGATQKPVHHAQPPQQPYRVGSGHQTGADLLQLRSLLIQQARQARPVQKSGAASPPIPPPTTAIRGMLAAASTIRVLGSPRLRRGPL